MKKSARKIVSNCALAFLPIFLYRIVMLLVMDAGSRIYGDVVIQHSLMLDAIASTILTAIFAVWLCRLRRKTAEVSLSWRWDKRLMISIPIITLGVSGISYLWLLMVDLGLQNVPILGESAQNHNEVFEQLMTQPYLWSFLSIVLIGPIVEELLFRGLVFRYLEKIRQGWFPILVSGIAFGLWHGEPVQCVYTAWMGIVLGLIYTKRRDIRIVIAIHILNNFLSALPFLLIIILYFVVSAYRARGEERRLKAARIKLAQAEEAEKQKEMGA